MRKRIVAFLLGMAMSLPFVAQNVRSHSPKLSANTIVAQRDCSDKQINLFVELSDEADLERLKSNYHIHFNTQAANVYTALLPVPMLELLVKDKDVLRVEVGQELRPMIDSVRLFTHVDEIHNGLNLPTSYTGRGIIVGVIDTGFDYTHPAFKDANGVTRIVAVWDQLKPFASSNNTYGYGQVYTSSEEIVANKRDLSPDTHGTHVAGIAAGSGGLRQFRGIAPESDIVFVSTNKTEQGVVDGVDFLLKYAEQRRQPLVINISFGVVLGFKDGSGHMPAMIDALLKDKKGALLAIAAGNEGHRAATLKTKETLKSYWNVPSYGRDNLFLMGEVDTNCSLKLTLRNVDTGEELFSEAFSTETEWTKSFGNFGTKDADRASIAVSSAKSKKTGRPSLSLNMIYSQESNEVWEVEINGNGGLVMLNCDYGTFAANGKEGYTDGSFESSIASSATGYEPIAVGAYVSRRSYKTIAGTDKENAWVVGDLYPMSGQGPTFDGRLRPEVLAPGASVISSLNSFAAGFSVPNEMKTHSLKEDGKTYYWGIANGTSMATPVVAGTLALWLQVKNDLTVSEVRQLLTTSQLDSFTEAMPKAAYGKGKLNAWLGLKTLLQTVSLDTISSENYSDAPNYRIDTDRRMLIAPEAKSIELFSLTGQRLRYVEGSMLNYSDFPESVYVIRINAIRPYTIKVY